MNKFSQALADEQVQYRNMVVDCEHPNGQKTKAPGCPIKLSRNNEESFTPAPLLGQHTDELMRNVLGYGNADVASLKEQGVIG